MLTEDESNPCIDDPIGVGLVCIICILCYVHCYVIVSLMHLVGLNVKLNYFFWKYPILGGGVSDRVYPGLSCSLEHPPHQLIKTLNFQI